MKICLPAILLLLMSSAMGQYPKLVVQLSDKQLNGFSLASPLQFLSDRAVQRRNTQKIGLDSTDLPVTQRYIDSIRSAGNVVVLSQSKWLNQVLILTTDQAALAKINAFPFVKKVKGVGYRPAPRKVEQETFEMAGRKEPRLMENAINYGSGYSQVHIHEGEYLHNKGYRGQNIQVAVLDAGFYKYKSNTAFDSIRLRNQILGVRDFVDFDNSVNEDDLHGANCLSILAANWPGRLVGSASGASYYLIRTEKAQGEYPLEEYNWAVGAEYADSSGADMISSSLGYYTFDDATFNHSYTQFYKNETTVSKAAAFAAKKGMIVMSSAGNEGNNSWKYIGFPADADSVCAVGAVNASGQIASFSSYGYPGKIKPNIVSIGQGTVLAGLNNQPVSGNGTSYSSPNVAGLVACLWQAFPVSKNMEILDAVYRSADRYAAPTDRYGFGIPNFKTAYKILKRKQNEILYGANWLVATPNPFKAQISGTFVAQVNGAARIELAGPFGQVLYSVPFVTEQDEVYSFEFQKLDSLIGGTYQVRYVDSLSSKLLTIQKLTDTNGDWVHLYPGNVFMDNLTVSFTSPETGTMAIRILDAKGSKVHEQQLQSTQNQNQTINLNLPSLAKGVYYLQLISRSQQTVRRLVKL